MNILYINNVMNFGGVEKCILKLSKNFHQNHKIIICSSGGPLVKEIEQLSNVKHYMILDTDKKDIKTIINNLKVIKRIIKEEKIDIVHSHHRMTTLYCKIIRLIHNFVLIHTQHLCIEDKIMLTKLALKRLPIITVSNSARDNLIDIYKLNPHNITTIYNTIEPNNCNSEVNPILSKLKQEGHFIVSHISRLVDYKGVYDLLEVAKKVSKCTTDIKFIIFGDGPERKSMEDYILKNNLTSQVYMLGNTQNIIQQLQLIDLVLLCSYIEGLPLVPLEAFSQGVPVIGTDIGGTNEEIEHGINGFLVNCRDIDMFVKYIMDLSINQNLYQKLSRQSQMTFMHKFNEETYKIKHLDYYNRFMNKES